jgi:phosphatidylserine synthase
VRQYQRFLTDCVAAVQAADAAASNLVPAGWELAVASAMLLSSAYGFASEDAKTEDRFFTGFPSYWNVAALYLFAGGLPAAVNTAILMTLAALVFVRIGYVYPSRTPTLRTLTVTLTTLWGACVLAIIVSLPNPSGPLIWNDPVNLARWSTYLILLADEAQGTVEVAMTTVDHSDIRGSEPHNRDPSGAASD